MSAKLYADFRDLGGKIRRRCLGVSDIASATRIAHSVQDALELLRAGGMIRLETLASSAQDVLLGMLEADHPLMVAKRRTAPICKDLHAYLQHLRASGRTDRHVHEVEVRVLAVVDWAKWLSISAITARDLERFLLSKQESGAGAAARNAYLVSVRSFCRWCVSEEILQADPTRRIRRANVQADRRQVHREFRFDEVRKLLDSTKARDADRYLAYKLMALAGLRVDECRRLEWRNVDLAHGYLRLRRKSQRVVDVRLHPELIADLADRPKPLDLRARVLRLPRQFNQAFDRDLLAARMCKVGPDGARFCPHSLRQSFGIWLYDSGSGIAEVQMAMDHATASQTDHYLRRMGRVVRDDAVTRLPGFNTPPSVGYCVGDQGA